MRVDFSSVDDREWIEDYPWYEMLMQDEYWMDQFGDKHLITEMETRYIKNCLPFAQKAARWMENRAWNFLMTLHGDIAIYTMEREIARLESPPLIEALTGELSKREDSMEMVDPDRYSTILTRHDG